MIKLVYHQLDSKDMRSIEDVMVFDRVHIALTGEFFREVCKFDYLPGNPNECKYVRVTPGPIPEVRLRRTFSIVCFKRPLRDGETVVLNL